MRYPTRGDAVVLITFRLGVRRGGHGFNVPLNVNVLCQRSEGVSTLPARPFLLLNRRPPSHRLRRRCLRLRGALLHHLCLGPTRGASLSFSRHLTSQPYRTYRMWGLSLLLSSPHPEAVSFLNPVILTA